MRLAHEVHGTEAEGPGRRSAVWLRGCPIRCPGCCNPELFDAAGPESDPAALVARILAADVEGVTVLGGEPFAQPEALAALVTGVRAGGRSVVVFTGYLLEDLAARPECAPALAAIDVLVDGPYDARRPERARRWLGSANQRLHFFTDRYSEVDFRGSNTVELRLEGGVLTINGWPDRRFERRAKRQEEPERSEGDRGAERTGASAERRAQRQQEPERSEGRRGPRK